MTAEAEAIIDRAIEPETSPHARCSELLRAAATRKERARAPPLSLHRRDQFEQPPPRLEPQQRTRKSDSGSPADLYSQRFCLRRDGAGRDRRARPRRGDADVRPRLRDRSVGHLRVHALVVERLDQLPLHLADHGDREAPGALDRLAVLAQVIHVPGLNS
jgi:hypothetical protein